MDNRVHLDHGRTLSRWGAGLGVACAIHCAVTPLLVGVLPLLGIGFLAESHTEEWITGAVVILAIVTGLWGYQQHRGLRVLIAFAGAVGLLLLGHSLGHEHPLSVASSVAGGLAIAGAHWWSAQLCRSCPNDPEHSCPS